MTLPIIASQAALLIGLWLSLSIILKKRRAVLDFSPEHVSYQKTFREFLAVQREKFRLFFGRYHKVARHSYYKFVQKVLHGLRLLALKLETISTKWLHQVKNTHQEKTNQPEKPKIAVEQFEQKTIIQNGNGQYFSTLKENSSHTKVENVLEELKGNGVEEE